MIGLISRIGLPGGIVSICAAALAAGTVYWWQSLKVDALDLELDATKSALSQTLGANKRLDNTTAILRREITIQNLQQAQLQAELSVQQSDFNQIRRQLSQSIVESNNTPTLPPIRASPNCSQAATKAALSLIADYREGKP